MEDFPVSLTILDQFSFERRMFEDIMYSIVFIHTLKRFLLLPNLRFATPSQIPPPPKKKKKKKETYGFLRINISYCAFDKLKSVLHLIKYI